MISIIHPSRGRPQKSFETIRKWNRAFMGCDRERVELIVSVDMDDICLNAYINLHGKNVIVNHNRSAVDAVNNAAKASTGNILIVVSDDTDCPDHWNIILTDAIGQSKDFLLKVDHGLKNSVVTMPVMDRAFYNRTGYIYYPEYKHLYCDTDLTERAKRLGRLIVRNDILFRHDHPELTGEPKDALYLRNDATYEQGKKLFHERQRINFGL